MAKDKTGGGIEKLAALMGGGEPVERFDEDDDEAMDEALVEDVNEILALAFQKAGNNIFDVQLLIETAADAVRNQIRELVEEGGEDDVE